MNSKPKLLICYDWFYPGVKAGGPIQSLVNLVELLQNDLSIYVITSSYDFGATTPYAVAYNQWQPFTLCPNVKVYYIKGNVYLHMIKELRQNKFDTIYLNSLFSIPFVYLPIVLKKMGFVNAKLIWSPRGAAASSALSKGNFKKRVFLAISKAIGLYQLAQYHATSVQEKKDIHQLLGNVPTTVIGNIPFAPSGRLHKPKRPYKLLFVGRIVPIKNLEFLLQAIAQVSIHVHLSIAGPEEDSDYAYQCKKLAQTLVEKGHCINWLGVCDRLALNELYATHDFLVSPTTGENFGHAIVEAMASGIPVIISDQTPWKFDEHLSGGFSLSLDSLQLWVDTLTIALTIDEAEYSVWSHQILHYYSTHFDVASLRLHYLKLFTHAKS